MSRLDEILALPKVTHNLVQGSPEWMAFRMEHDGASEAAAMLGLSKKVKRSELLHQKHTGLPREFSDWLQRNVLDRGHEVEAKARPHVEALIGDDLYPVTCSRGRTSASCDGLTMDDRRALEHKQWAEDLAAMVAAGVLPDEHWPQCQQILMVTGAEELYFVVSDGTPEKMVYLIVTPERDKWERLADGWHQFNIDLAAYEPPAAAAPMVVAAPVQALPAVSVVVDGTITIRDNFAAFEVALRDFLEHRLIREPKTDQDFADLDVQIKAMKGAEAALDTAEAGWIAQVDPISQAKRTKDMLAKLVRENRLMAEKLLASEKERRREQIVAAGRAALEEHVRALNQRLGKPYMPAIPADFGAAIRGLKSLASMEDKVATLLANTKILANEIADKIDVNLKALRELAADHVSLFADTPTLVLKAPDDCRAQIEARIAAHKAEQERRAAELAERERARIRAEEEAKARAQALREQQEREAEDRRQRAAAEEEQRRQQAEKEALTRSEPEPKQIATAEAAAPADNVRPMPTRAPAAPAQPAPRTLTLTAIAQRLGFALPAAFVADKLGVAGEKDRSAVKFSEPEFDLICASLRDHVEAVRMEHAHQRAA